ncbi:MAG TPA: acetyltransferase [Tepidisphaeraceae bacterium]|jgi:UDP-perosamine 4-acetyltransferase
MDAVIIGAGGHGKVVLDALQCAGGVRIVGFLDAAPGLHGTLVSAMPVLGGTNQFLRLRQQKIRGVIVAIGDNRIRRQYAAEAEAAGFELISVVHPTAVVSRSARIGRNVLIAAGAIICPDVQIADSVIVNTAAVVDHDCNIGHAAHIAPGAVLAGRVTVREMAFVGLGARILPCFSIGARAVIGAGAVILADVPDDRTAVGVPARLLPSP